jgi:hypothetical protein
MVSFTSVPEADVAARGVFDAAMRTAAMTPASLRTVCVPAS